MTLGYILGGLLVLILIPSVIYSLTILTDLIYKIDLVQNITIQWIIVLLLLVIGFSFGFSSIIYQNIIGKGGPLEISNIEISPKTKNLVVSGPYRYTRNPMLFGTFLIYLAFATWINSLNAILLVILFIVFMLSVVVRNEEKRLLKDFGNQYEEYRRKTSLFIPWFPRNK